MRSLILHKIVTYTCY